MAHPEGHTGIKRLVNAIRYSWQGIRAAYQHEEAFRQEILLAVIAIPLALYLGDTNIEQALLISAILLIMIAELLNTGIEAITDRVSTDHHELAGRAKDIGSAAVMLSFVHAAAVWGLILFF